LAVFADDVSFSTLSGAQKLNFIEGAENFKSMDCTCIGEMRRQIQKEMEASITYLAMAAHFSQDTVNRPGFANFFFNSASEEREHSMKLIDYLLMRGEPSQNLTGLISVPVGGLF
jgi:ferritin heavy chain